MDLFEYYYPKISEDNLLESKEDFISLEEFCYKFEKDAIANGLYKLIMDNPNVDPYTTLEKTPHYRNIKKIKFNVIDNDNRQLIEPVVKKYFNKSYKWFYSMANKVVKSYINKIGKILTKAYNDIYKDKTPLDGGFIGGTDIEI